MSCSGLCSVRDRVLVQEVNRRVRVGPVASCPSAILRSPPLARKKQNNTVSLADAAIDDSEGSLCILSTFLFWTGMEPPLQQDKPLIVTAVCVGLGPLSLFFFPRRFLLFPPFCRVVSPRLLPMEASSRPPMQPRAPLPAAACALLAMLFCLSSNWMSVVVAVPDSYFINRTNTCMASVQTPRQPAPLEFCYWLNDNACCLPAHDASIMAAYEALLSLGAGCAPAKHSVRAAFYEIRQLICLPCHPREPAFRFRTRDGDEHLGGNISGDSAAAEDHFTWRVCKSFLYGRSGKRDGGLWGVDGHKFDACGVQQPGDCSKFKQWGYNATSGSWIEGPAGFPPGPCDASLIVPSVEFAGLEDPAEKMAQMVPSLFSNFNFVVVDDLDPRFNARATPCFGAAGGAASAVLAVTLSLALALLFW